MVRSAYKLCVPKKKHHCMFFRFVDEGSEIWKNLLFIHVSRLCWESAGYLCGPRCISFHPRPKINRLERIQSQFTFLYIPYEVTSSKTHYQTGKLITNTRKTQTQMKTTPLLSTVVEGRSTLGPVCSFAP